MTQLARVTFLCLISLSACQCRLELSLRDVRRKGWLGPGPWDGSRTRERRFAQVHRVVRDPEDPRESSEWRFAGKKLPSVINGDYIVKRFLLKMYPWLSSFSLESILLQWHIGTVMGVNSIIKRMVLESYFTDGCNGFITWVICYKEAS